ncbi:hypothetical protein JCM10295v2_003428 [Rhodotorula toruloides]
MFTERHTRSRPPTSSSLSKRSRTTPSRSSSSSSILRTLVNWFIIVLITNLALSRAVTQSWTWGHEGKWSNPRTIRDLLFPSPPLTLSESQLALHDGSKPSQYPLYIAIDGDVYDVSDGGMRNYGPGGAYSAFAGRDAARAFVTGCFKTHLTHDLRGLSEGDLEQLAAAATVLCSDESPQVANPRMPSSKIVENWKSFYAKHAKYRYVGRVVHPPIDPSTPIPEPCDGGKAQPGVAAAAALTTGLTPHAPVTTSSLAQSIITSIPSSIDGAGAGSSTSLAVAASSSGTGASTATTTSTGVISTSTAVPAGYDLPEAFDSTLGNNFTSTACPSFFATFLANPRFKTCAPFSLLLTTSTGFFQAERAPYGLLPYVLNASCTASQEECTGLMDSLAAKIQQQNTCGPDLAKGNPLAVEALNGFRSYRLMREAGCQLSNTTGRFCFAEASAKTNPSDLYYYYLPEGTSLPSGATPDCDACTQNLLAVYARYATNTTLAISKTYASGRTAAALACGPNFAPLVATSTAGGKSAASVTVAFDTRITILAAGLGILGPLLLAT